LYAVRRSVENVYLVRERDRKRTRELLALVFAIVPPMIVLFAAIWANIETVRLGYQLERVQVQVSTLDRKHRNLLSERAQIASLSRVEAIASKELGLSAPRLGQVIQVKDGALAESLPAPLSTPPPIVSDLPEMYGPPAPPSTEEGF
jgi:cell division protein FtsL